MLTSIPAPLLHCCQASWKQPPLLHQRQLVLPLHPRVAVQLLLVYCQPLWCLQL
jgi:hypothetical protein